MGVYIKGMEMPKTCGDCPCYVLEQDCCGITFDDVSCLDISGQKNCPLVPVPEHGRLGDLDALIDKVIAKYLEHERKGELVFTAAEIKQGMVDLISDEPTIIPASEEGKT